MALVGAAAAVVIGRVFGLIELYVLGAALAVVVVWALAGARRALPTLQVGRHARPEIVPVGEPARIDLAVRNTGHRRSSPLRLWEPVGARGGAPMRVASIGANQVVTAAYRVPTERRGVIHIGPLDAERTDLLGLAQRRWTVPGVHEILVVPHVLPVTVPIAGSTGSLGQHLKTRSLGQRGSEFHSLRTYVTGDDPRAINWKATARSLDLIVRQTNPDGLMRCAVVLDDTSGMSAAGWERAVSIAASLVTAAQQRGLNTRLVSSAFDLRGPTVADMSLRALALAEQSDTPRLISHGIGSGTTEGLGLVIVISASDTTSVVTDVRASVRNDDTLVTVACDAAPTSRGFVVDATDLTLFVAQWSNLARVAA
jgi:uncharacterized protein (DUF58 family)